MNTRKLLSAGLVLSALLFAMVACGDSAADTLDDNSATNGSTNILESEEDRADSSEVVLDQAVFDEQITEFIEQRMAEDHLPGAAVAVVRGDDVIYAEGFGLRDVESAVLRVSDAERNPNFARSYVLEDNVAVEAEREDVDGDPLAPSGALKANVLEMAAYISTQLNQGQAPNAVRVVSEENLHETWEPGLENYAMGWEVNEYQDIVIISHEGAFDNYVSVIGFAPDLNVGFVILTNSEEAGERLIEAGPTFLIDLMINS